MILNEDPEEITTINITRPSHETQAISNAIHQYEQLPTFSNLHNLSRLCGLPTPTHLNQAHPITNYRDIMSQAPLKKVPLEETQRSLGFFFNLKEPSQSVDKKIHEKVNSFVSKIVTRRLSTHDIIRALFHIQVPSMLYVLHGHNANATVLDRESHRLSSTLLPLLGLNRHIPLQLRYAPLSRGGFALPNLYCEMGIIKLKQVLRDIRRNTDAGQLMLIALKWIQQLTGSGLPLLREVEFDIDYIDPNWWSGVRSFLKRINGKLQFEQTYIIPPNVVDDRSLMERLENIISDLMRKIDVLLDQNQLIKLETEKFHTAIHFVEYSQQCKNKCRKEG